MADFKPQHHDKKQDRKTPDSIEQTQLPEDDLLSPHLLQRLATSATPPDPKTVNQIFRLQSQIGNQAVQRLIAGEPHDYSGFARLGRKEHTSTISRSYGSIQREGAPIDAPASPTPSDDFMGEDWKDINKYGLVYQDEGANLRDKPLPPGDGSTVITNLKQNTKVFIMKHNPAPQNWYAVRVMEGENKGTFGYVADWLVRDDMPDADAVMYSVQDGDMLGKLVQTHEQYKNYDIQLGDDARSLVMAVYMANKENGGVRLNPAQKKDKPWYEDAYDWAANQIDDYRDELSPIYEQIELIAGKQIWLPGITYIETLKASGVIPDRSEWLNDAITVTKGIGGFTVGLVEGFLGSIVDLLVGLYDLVDSIIDMVISIATGEALSMAQDLYEFLEEMVKDPTKAKELFDQIISALTSSIADSWETFKYNFMDQPNPYDLWHFRGKVIGYIVAEAVMLYFSGGASAAKWLGRLGKVMPKLSKLLTRIGKRMDDIPDLKKRKKRDRDRDDNETGERQKAKLAAVAITESHDAAGSSIPTLMANLAPLTAKYDSVKGFDHRPTRPGHYAIIMRTVVDGDFTPGRDDEGQLSKKIDDTVGLGHSFDRHAHEWFGRPVRRETHMGQWQTLLERAAGSSKSVPWKTGNSPTIGHIARIEGKNFFVQFFTTGPRAGEVATAFIPNQSQLSRIYELLRKK